MTAVMIKYGGRHDQCNASAAPMTRLKVTPARPGAPLTAANASARCSPWWSLIRAGMTITNSAPPRPASAVPVSVIGHAGPRQNIVMPVAIATAEVTNEPRRPRRSTTRTPNKPAQIEAKPNVEPCSAAITPDRWNWCRNSPRTTPTLSPPTSSA